MIDLKKFENWVKSSSNMAKKEIKRLSLASLLSFPFFIGSCGVESEGFEGQLNNFKANPPPVENALKKGREVWQLLEYSKNEKGDSRGELYVIVDKWFNGDETFSLVSKHYTADNDIRWKKTLCGTPVWGGEWTAERYEDKIYLTRIEKSSSEHFNRMWQTYDTWTSCDATGITIHNNRWRYSSSHMLDYKPEGRISETISSSHSSPVEGTTILLKK